MNDARAHRRFVGLSDMISPGAWVIIALALLASLWVVTRPPENAAGKLQFWIFARTHQPIYAPLIEQWNKAHTPQVDLSLLGIDAETQRMVSGFYSHLPTADCFEVERGRICGIFNGPVNDVGFVDLTDILHKEGVYNQINEPSFSPWIMHGRIFGIPHDVHPIMLAYRSDIVEAAGIDVNQIETWDDYVRLMRPLMRERDADGNPKHYLLNIWPTGVAQVEALVLQAGGAYFDPDGHPTLDTAINAHVFSTVVSWVAGPNRIAADAPEFSASGNQLRLDGYIIGSIMPDWLTGTWKSDMPTLSGKVKLMPLPAWEKGGRRTSVWGGTMLGIPKTAPNFAATWEFAKYLYLSPDVARQLYSRVGIISPVKTLWDNPMYDQPEPYFCGQHQGRLFIQLAGAVPRRTSSPFYIESQARVQEVIFNLRTYAQTHGIYEPAQLIPEAHRLLALSQAQIEQQMSQNKFLDQDKP